MKNIYLKLVTCVLLLLVMGCNTPKPMVLEHTITKEVKVTEKVRDTIVEIVPDSSFYKALIDCKNGKALIREGTEKTSLGRNLNRPKVSLENNVLQVDCESQAQKLFISWKEKYIKETEKEKQPVTINVLTFWQELQIKGFRLFMLILGGYVLIKLIKFAFKYYGISF